MTMKKNDNEDLTKQKTTEVVSLDTKPRILTVPEPVEPITFNEWRNVIANNFPDLFFASEIGLSIIAQILIKDVTNPFALVLVDVPSAGKTIAINFFSEIEGLTYATDKFTPGEVRDLLKNVEIDIDPASLLRKSTEIWNEYEASSPAKQKTLIDNLNKKLEQASAVVALDNHYFMAETLDNKKYRTLLIEVTDQLVAEYDCKTASEKMLAQTAGWAYCRMIEYSYKLNAITRTEFISNEKNGYYSVLSKEVDRCTRQYLAAINTLKHFKQPALKVTFNANNAFVAQNQQINSDAKDKTEGLNNDRQ